MGLCHWSDSLMKVNEKKTKLLNKKQAVKASPKTQTITSMFKRQIATKEEQSEKQTKSASSDDDVQFMGTESPYFKKQSSSDSIGDVKHARRRLSHRKSGSSKDTGSTIKLENNDNCGEEDEKASGHDKVEKEQDSDHKQAKKSRLSLRKSKNDFASKGDETNTKIADTVDLIGSESLKTENGQIKKDPDKGEHLKISRKRKSDVVESEVPQKDKKSKLSEGKKSLKLAATKIETNSNENEHVEESTDGTEYCANDIYKKLELTVNLGNPNLQKKNQNEKLTSSPKNSVPVSKQNNINKTSKTLMKKDGRSASRQISSHKQDEEDENSQPLEAKGDGEEEKGSEFRTPYYLENFRTVLTNVFEDENNAKLYNADDMKIISTFNDLSEPAQKLYLRLFCRKWTWFPVSKIKYPEIAEDLNPVIEELTDAKLFVTESELQDLNTTLNLLSGADIKSLGKTYHVTGGQSKVDIIDLLVKKTKQNTIGSMFKMKGNSLESVMLNRAKKLLGSCVQVSEEPRDVFARTLMLFSLTDTVLDEDSSGQSLQLFQMLRVNIGQIIYPSFTVNKQTQIFPDRDTLLRFCRASLLEFDILTKLERNKYTEAFCIYEKAVKQYDQLIKDKKLTNFDKKLPVFLRPYTACGVYTRALNQGVEILQRQKDYQAAVDLLNKLLDQDCYCQHYRGHWWERLALNYDTHLKRPDLALDAVKNGLDDRLCKTGRRLSLYQRAEKICTAAKSKFKARMKEFQHEKLLDLPTVTIEGQTLSDNIDGQRHKFMIQCSQGQIKDEEDFAFCNVEEVVLDHYKHNGFTDGIHAEGAVISCLFGLLFWEIIFTDIPDVFHSPYQTHPLDLHTEEFYKSRRQLIDDRLAEIESSSNEDLNLMVADTWEKHEGTMCLGLNWERFNNIQHVQSLVECIGGKTLAGILGRYVKDPRNTRSGFPDLTLWNTDTKHFKICEVKGPGDKLSHKQILWLDYLLKLGVDAEVCHVKAVGSKRLKKTSSVV